MKNYAILQKQREKCVAIFFKIGFLNTQSVG
jgi:hypothetical protein